MAKNDLTGQVFGRLTVVKDDGSRQAGKIKWLCQCDCGNHVHVRTDHLKSGKVQSCGCLNDELKQSRFKDLTGLENGNFKVIEKIGSKNQRAIWLCKCKHCGRHVELNSNEISRYKSCGCLKGSSKERLDHIREPKSKWNDKIYKNNRSGVRGVNYIEKKGLWRADIGVNGRKIYLGSFKDKADAIKAREKAEEEYWKQILKIKF